MLLLFLTPECLEFVIEDEITSSWFMGTSCTHASSFYKQIRCYDKKRI